MYLYDVHVNYVAVIIGMIIYWVLGAIWYSQSVFGAHYVKHDPSISEKKGEYPIAVNYIAELIVGFTISYVLAVFIEVSNALLLSQGVIVAIWAWIGFIATFFFSAIIWGKKTIQNAFIHSFFLLVALILISLVISGMK